MPQIIRETRINHVIVLNKYAFCESVSQRFKHYFKRIYAEKNKATKISYASKEKEEIICQQKRNLY